MSYWRTEAVGLISGLTCWEIENFVPNLIDEGKFHFCVLSSHQRMILHKEM